MVLLSNKLENSIASLNLDGENIYSLFELLKRLNQFINTYAKDLDLTGTEMERLATKAQIMSENIVKGDALFNPVAGTYRIIDQFLGVSLNLFTSLFNKFAAGTDSIKNRLIVPSNELHVYMEFILKSMIMYVLVMAQIEHSLRSSRARWQSIYQADVEAFLADQSDISVMIDKNINMNMCASNRTDKGESIANVVQLYNALLQRTIKSFQNTQFIKLLGDMETFSKRLAKQVSERPAIQLKRNPIFVRDDSDNSNLALLEMRFLSGDVEPSVGNRSGQILRELFAPDTSASQCQTDANHIRKRPFLSSAYGAADYDHNANTNTNTNTNDDVDMSSSDGEDSTISIEDGDGDEDIEKGGATIQQLEQDECMINRDDDDMRLYKRTLDVNTSDRDKKHAELNNVLQLLEDELSKVSAKLPDINSLDVKPYEKLTTLKCLYKFLQKYLKALLETGEEIYRDSVYTLSPDLLGLVEEMKKDDTGINFMINTTRSLEDGVQYIIRHVGLVKALLDKYLDLSMNIAVEFDRFMFVKNQALVLTSLMDSHIKTVMATIHVDGTVLYNCVPYAIVPDLVQVFEDSTDLYQKYDAVKSALSFPGDINKQFFIQINSFVMRPLEELVLGLPQIEGDTFFNNDELSKNYTKYYNECVTRYWEFSAAYLYLIRKKEAEIERLRAAPPAPTTQPNQIRMPQLVVKGARSVDGSAYSGASRSMYELVPIEKELPANDMRYYKCISASVAAVRQTRKSLPFLVFNLLHSVEPAILIDAMYNFGRNTKTAASLLGVLNSLIALNHYTEVGKAPNTTLQEDVQNMPPMASTLYKRMLLAALALAPTYESVTVDTPTKSAVIVIKDADLANHYTRFFTKTGIVKNLEQQAITIAADAITFTLDARAKANSLDLTIKPEFFKDMAASMDGQMPNIMEYLISSDALRDQDTAHNALFPRISDKSYTDNFATLDGRLALLNNLGSSVSYSIVKIEHLTSSNNVFTLHPYLHNLAKVEFKIIS